MNTLGSRYSLARNHFDLLRFLLAAAVIWSHCYPLSGRDMDLLYAFSRQVNAGSLAVDCFFIISGFLVTQSWLRTPRIAIYGIKRVLRLGPALVAASIFGAFAVAPWSADLSFRQYIAAPSPYLHMAGVLFHRFLAIPAVFTGNPLPHVVNGSLWSLRYEILCYMLLPCLFVARTRRVQLATIAIGAALTWGYSVATGFGHSITDVTARLLCMFLIGATYYLARDYIPMSRRCALAAFVALILLLRLGGFRVLFPGLGGYCLLYLASSRSGPLVDFGRYGDFSYGMYVYAYPIQQLLVSRLGDHLPFPAFFPLALIATIAVAALSWHVLEKPALRLKPSASRPLGAAHAQPRRGRVFDWLAVYRQ